MKPLISLLILTALVAAKQCLNITVPLSISSRNAVFDLVVPQTNPEVTTFIQNLTQQGRNFSDIILRGYATISGTYNISAKFCTPSHGSSSVVQILTHGIGFDKTYWDLPYNAYNYSYIDTATESYGYSTLSYDRLGTGKSSHGDPLNEIQAFLEIQSLQAMTKLLRNGSFPMVNMTASKIIHVGHSFGSAQTYVLVSIDPTVSDGIVLTGFATNSTFLPLFQSGALFQLANTNQPLRFGSVANGMVIENYIQQLITTAGASDFLAGFDLAATLQPSQDLPNGYIVSANAQADQYLFLYPSQFDPQLASLAGQTKQPVTLGELLTIGSLPMTNPFAGPVLAFTAEHDLPFCGGDCLATGDPTVPSIPAQVKMAFPMVQDANFSALIQPSTGHGLNLHYNATAGYRAINDWLGDHGLAASS